MAKLRLGVIGAGSWAVRSHLPNLARRSEQVEFVGVARKGPELLARIQRDWDFKVASEDYRDVLAAGIDIAVIASPTAAHFEHAKAALEAGAHVLVEKPFTMTPQQAWELVRLAGTHGRHLVICYGYNYRPMVQETRRLLLESGGIGDLETMSIYMASVTRGLLSNQGAYPKASPWALPESATWTDPQISGGGYGQAQLTHALGAALWLSGLDVDDAFAFMSGTPGTAVELHAACALRLCGGGIATMLGSSSHEGAAANRDLLSINLVGSTGQLQSQFELDRISLFRPPDETRAVTLPAGSGEYDCDGPPNTLVDLALGKDVENCSPGHLGARVVEALDACYRSAETAQPAHVDRSLRSAPNDRETSQ